jgi:hypothetical protein
MNNPRPFPVRVVTLSTLLVSALFVLGCQQSQPTGAGAPPPSPAAEKLLVIFEGPWAVAPDPKDPGKILLIAPKTASHKDLYVSASNGATLTAGVYDLSVPVSGTVAAPTVAADFAQAKTTPADLQRVLDSKSARYVIRLPKPEAYLAASRFRSRVGASYPPDASTEKDYASSVSLRYSVSSMNGFSLSGSPDSGAFKPFLLNVETPTVNFVIDPLHDIDPSEKCHVHAREAFRDLTRLLKVTLYIDFPDSPASCHDKDPQKSKAAENVEPSRTNALQALLRGNVMQVQTASVVPGITPAYLMFATRPLFCTGAIIILNL